jgi:hypothetical protein
MTHRSHAERVIFTRLGDISRERTCIHALFQAGMEDATQRETTQEMTL